MSGGVGTNIEGLRGYGQRVGGKADEAKALDLGQFHRAVFLPGSETAKALAESGEAYGAVANAAQGRLSFAGTESVVDAGTYEQVEEDSAERLQSTGESVAEYRW
ncbi:MAG: hypothetical protein ACRC20_05685 [Segniliparus sp.]|uniref:hypothetical protein n=1 Tax=Segniliparus sp. TaxID=2804064 RepID=UPI003F2B2150